MSGICGFVGEGDGATIETMLEAISYRGDSNDIVTGAGFGLGYRHWQGRPGKSPIIHRGVDTTLFSPASLTQERLDAVRSAWGIVPGDPVIFQAARLTRWKGQTVLIDALARLPASASPWTAILGGDDQGRTGYTAELRRQIEDDLALGTT